MELASWLLAGATDVRGKVPGSGHMTANSRRLPADTRSAPSGAPTGVTSDVLN